MIMPSIIIVALLEIGFSILFSGYVNGFTSIVLAKT